MIKKTIFLFMLFGGLFISAGAAVAADLNSFGSSIFRLQKKTAMRGNSLAQYKLGTFYEFGMSVSPNLTNALLWYKKAAKKSYQPAVDRLTFYEIKDSSFDAAKHSDWLHHINEDAKKFNPNALILLGQMYQQGIGVKKNLRKAETYLAKASSLGRSEVDPVLNRIRKKIRPKKVLSAKPEIKILKKKEPENITLKAVEKKVKKVDKQQQVENENRAIKEKQEKMHRYEAAMRKLYREQLILQQQQDWAESMEDSE